jgi:hypothetical protein
MIMACVFYDSLNNDLKVLEINLGSWNFIDAEVYYGYEFVGIL